MVTPDYLVQLFEYNQWANARVLDVAEPLSPTQLMRPQGHSWGSVHATLVHMMAAEWIWMRRLRGHSPGALLDPATFPNVPAIRARWNAIAAETLAFLRVQTPQTLLQVVDYANTSGRPFSLAAWKIQVHVANHATHHRGELAAMYALMEVPHPEEYWYYYFLEQSGQIHA
jgi:uncharacterized damage-inducible protein DinB